MTSKDRKFKYVYLSCWINEHDGKLYCSEQKRHHFHSNARRSAGIVRGNTRVTVFVAHWNDVFEELTEDVMRQVAREYLDGKLRYTEISLRYE